jgi:hypothetical protein
MEISDPRGEKWPGDASSIWIFIPRGPNPRGMKIETGCWWFNLISPKIPGRGMKNGD